MPYTVPFFEKTIVIFFIYNANTMIYNERNLEGFYKRACACKDALM